jgi:hypothetical protein
LTCQDERRSSAIRNLPAGGRGLVAFGADSLNSPFKSRVPRSRILAKMTLFSMLQLINRKKDSMWASQGQILASVLNGLEPVDFDAAPSKEGAR